MGLFKQKWKHENINKRLAWINNSNPDNPKHQEIFIKILENKHEDNDVKLVAVGKINNEKKLSYISQSLGYDECIQLEAVKRITDFDILKDIITAHDKYNSFISLDVIIEAFLRIVSLDDQNILNVLPILEEISSKYYISNNNITERVIDNIVSENVLLEILKICDNGTVRREAVKKVTNQDYLKEFAKNDPSQTVQLSAIENITDQQFLIDIVKTSNDWLYRNAALNNLSDQNLLKEIAKNDENNENQILAAIKLKDQVLKEKIVIDNLNKIHNSYEIPSIIEKIKDQDLLKKIVSDCFCANKYAIKQISDQQFLNHIARKHKDKSVRKEAAKNLKDKTLISKIHSSEEKLNTCGKCGAISHYHCSNCSIGVCNKCVKIISSDLSETEYGCPKCGKYIGAEIRDWD